MVSRCKPSRFCSFLREVPLLLGILVLSFVLSFGRATCLFAASPSETAVRPNGGWGAVWSPQGDRIAFLSSTDGLPDDAWLTDRQGKSFRRLTHGGANSLSWSEDGRTLSYSTNRHGRSELWQVNLDSCQETPQALPFKAPSEASQCLSPDGRSVAYVSADSKSRDLYLSLNGEASQRITSDFIVGAVCWAPKGDKIAFDGINPYSKGLPQVWVYDLATKNLAHVGSTGSFSPVWSAKGDLLAYCILYASQKSFVGITRLDALKPMPNPASAKPETTKPEATIKMEAVDKLKAAVESDAVAKPKAAAKHPKFDISKGGLISKLIYQGDGMAWSPAEDVLAVVARGDTGQEVWLVKSDSTVIRKFSKRDLIFRFPAWTPDGKRIAFEAMQKGASAFSEIWVTDSKGKSWRNLTPSRPSYWALSPAATGRTFFLSNVAGVKKACYVDMHSSSTSPTALEGTDGASYVAASPQGDRVLVLKPKAVMLLTADGKTLNELNMTGAFEASWSPRGDRIAVGVKSGTSEDSIKFLSAAEDKLTEVSSIPGSDPSWRADGSAVAFVRSNLIWYADIEGKNPQALATVPVGQGEEAFLVRPVWSPQGDSLAFSVTRTASEGWQRELWRISIPANGSAPAEPVRIYSEPVMTEFSLAPERYGALPAWIADGRLLFSSDRGGTPQVWSLSDATGEPIALTLPNTLWPVCATDTKWVYFVQPDDVSPIWRMGTDGSQASPIFAGSKQGLRGQ